MTFLKTNILPNIKQKTNFHKYIVHISMWLYIFSHVQLAMLISNNTTATMFPALVSPPNLKIQKFNNQNQQEQDSNFHNQLQNFFLKMQNQKISTKPKTKLKSTKRNTESAPNSFTYTPNHKNPKVF